MKGRRRRQQQGKDRDRGRHSRRRSEKKRQSRPAAPSRKGYLGRIQKNPRGFAFVIPRGGGQDYYIGPEEASALLNDDVVEFTLVRQRGRLAAHVTRVVERRQKEIVGRLDHQGHRWWVATPEGDIFTLARPPSGATRNHWVLARIDKYPTKHQPGQVVVEQVMGAELKPRHDLLLAMARFGLPRQFSPDALEEGWLGKVRARKGIEDPARVDLRDLPLVTIDGPDAKDFDDAVYVARNQEGSPFVLYVAIADVSAFVVEGTPLDRDAVERGTSVYFPGIAIPMLPEILSNDLCSLVPRTDRLAFTAEIHCDRHGKPVRSRFYESVIRTAARLTYEQVQRFLDDPDRAADTMRELAGPLRSAQALYRLMARNRVERGVLDFDLPESKIEVDVDGRPLRCERAARFDAHKLIEEFMIAANSAVAKALREGREGALYRVHEPPAPGAIDEVNQMMRNLGISKRMEEATPKAFSKILEATRGMKGSATLHQSILRLQKQARYEPQPKGHFGLALADYAHFTSPIRRYPDLVVHRALKRLIGAFPRSDKKNGEDGSLEALGERLSDLERRAMEAERFVVKRKHCWFLKERLGEVFDGAVAGVTAKGLFVEISPHCIEGFLPMDSLGGFYEFDEKRQCLRQRPGHRVIAVGDPMTVLVDHVSLDDQQITFAPA